MTRRYLAALLVVAILGACATETGVVRDGKEYGVTDGVFRGRWWSYYERGASFLAGEFYKEAESDLREALKGRGKDSWQARTYGLHFTEYFPNRELGVTYFSMGQLEEAERYLKASLEGIDTERAHYYLDQIAKARIAKGDIKDDAAPVVDTSLEDKIIVAVREVPIEIIVSDDVGVEKVKINDVEVPQRASAKKIVIEQKVLLTEGPQEIRVEVADLAEKDTVKTIKVEVDLTGPTIGIFAPIDPTVTESTLTRIEGTTIDKNGVVSVALGARIVAESRAGDKRLEFATDLPLASGENSFIVMAKDVAGNETRSSVKVFRGKPGSVAARLWLLKQYAPRLLQLARVDGPGVFPGFLFGAEEVTEALKHGVRINLKCPVPEKPYRHNRTLRISGDAISGTKIASLTINGEPFENLTGAPKESFNKRIPIDLDEDGETTVKVLIVAKDTEGNEATKEFEILIRPITMNSRESKMPVAVLAFAGSGIDPATSDMLRVTAEAKLIEAERFRIVDRTRLQDVLNEQQLAAALANPNDAIALGKLTNAYVFLVADVFERGQKGLEIKARAISTETSDVLATLDVFIDDKTDSAKIDAGCRALADQVAKAFPRLSGELMAVKDKPDGAELLVNWTKEDGVREGMYLLVVKEDEPWVDDTTGEILEPGEIVEVCRAKIQSILSSGSKAKAVKPADAEGEDVKLEKGMAAVSM